MNKTETIERIRKTGVLPVIRAASADDAALIIERIVAGGIDVIEITMTVPGAAKLIAESVKKYGADAVIGAGTVLTADDAAICIDAGAQFIVSPALDLKTIEFCNGKGIAVMPGALTPTEVTTAWNAGADIVKVFPAGAMGGASYLRSLKAPLPHIKLIPTGGVTLETAAGFIRAGAEAVGVGADLVNIEALRGDPNSITETARKYLKTVADARQN
jgi:2-dehydro-3-deoxyphosphogluconate aldolase/(4S)-4-hydroxy-2-oxoglutarate aldolase